MLVPAGHPGKRKDSGCNRSLPPHHLCMPRFPNFPLDGGLVLRDRFLLPSSAPHPAVGCSSAWASSNPASLTERARQAHVLGPSAAPHPRTGTSAQRPLPQVTPRAALWPCVQSVSCSGCLSHCGLEPCPASTETSSACRPRRQRGHCCSSARHAPGLPDLTLREEAPFLPLPPQAPGAGPAPAPGCQMSASRPPWNLGTSNRAGRNWAEPVRRRGLGRTQGRPPGRGYGPRQTGGVARVGWGRGQRRGGVRSSRT